MSRRGFLAGGAATPFAFSRAAQGATADDLKLELDLSADGSLLTARQTVKLPDEKVWRLQASWEAHAASFGPRAWFDLRFNDRSPETRRLVVHDAEFGGAKGVRLTFSFAPPSARAGEDPSWSIALSTDLWKTPGQALWTSAAVRFVDFAQVCSRVTLSGSAEAKSGRHRLDGIFDKRVSSPQDSPLLVEFLEDATWRLSRRGGVAVTSFEGQVTAEAFSFGWHAVGKHRPVLWGHAEAEDGVSVASPFTLGGSPGLRIAVSSRVGSTARRSKARWEVTRAQTPSAADSQGAPIEMTYAKVTFDPLRMSVADGKTSTASSLRPSRLFATEVRLPIGDQRSRRTLWGNVEAANAPWTIATSAGRLSVNAPALPQTQDQQKREGVKECSAMGGSDNDGEADATIAFGDGSGAPGATIWAVFDRLANEREDVARRIAVDLALLGADLALPDASRSALNFGGPGPDGEAVRYADLRLVYQDGQTMPELTGGEYPRREPSSFIWLGQLLNGSDRARIDLSRAELAASRDVDLMNVRFRFLDLSLELKENEAPFIQPRHADCRVIETTSGTIRDDRPVLVVDFDPQHVFEEVLVAQFLQLPDSSDGETRENILREISERNGNIDDLVKYRSEILKSKSDACPDFGDFAKSYNRESTAAKLPKDQRIYVGPFALDPDAMAVARKVAHVRAGNIINGSIDAMFARVADFIAADKVRDPAFKALLTVDGEQPGTQLDHAIRNEAVLEQQEPNYKTFRDFYRDVMTRAYRSDNTCQPTKDYPFPRPAARRQLDLEFFHPNNSPGWTTGGNAARGDPSCVADPRKSRFDAVKSTPEGPSSFLAFLIQADAPKLNRLIEARLSNRSRLAFRLNCAPPLQGSALEAGLATMPRGSAAEPEGGGVRYGPIPFSFAGLTDWSRHEPAVTRRASKLFGAAPDGLLPPAGTRAANLQDADVLAFQGISRKPVTADQRLGEIRAAIARKPSAFETAIELPARVVLSTAQDAVWFTRRPLPGTVGAEFPGSHPSASPAVAKPASDRVLKAGEIERSSEKLWMVRLDLEGLEPNLRVVDSPDLRPDALNRRPESGEAQWGQGAPPRGPFAPWFIGSEQMDGVTLMPPDDAPPGPNANPSSVWGLLRLLRTRRDARNQVDANGATYFPATLDAYDRHELVLLSSAYGLPVIGKRQSDTGQLVRDSGQIDPGDTFAVLDADDGQAIQRPQPLRATELWLSAMGGTLLHDTTFAPSVGALARSGGKIFDGFSIERWRQEIVLGRDIVGEVVYKGYLFPFGHRASLVKLTERLFLLHPEFGVKAVLVQRVFLRVGRRSQAYPALGQPFDGRLWCARDVTIKTVQTPDLQDPFANLPPSLTKKDDWTSTRENNRGGRIALDDAPGLAFWPRLNETDDGLIRFELTIDGAATKAPLIFVDNIAATTPATMKVLIQTYRAHAAWIPRRTLQLRDQKIRFAPETKSGDCTLKTSQMVLTASGRVRTLGVGWVELIEAFGTTAILEGAEQPPFYPALQTAEVRLEQAERFSGRDPVHVKAQYDGRYARFGFSKNVPPQNGALPHRTNPLEIFLDLCSAVAVGMGDHGDRAGGIGRPDTIAVAIGRINGPVGSNILPTYCDQAPAASDLLAGGAAFGPQQANDDGHLVEGSPLIAGGANGPDFPVLHSLADFFDPYASGTPQALGTIGRSSATSASATTRQIREILKVFFSAEAKILGVVSFAELLDFLGFEGVTSLADATPILKETLRFGAGVEQAGGDLVEEIHGSLIAPLRETVQKFDTQWQVVSKSLSPPGGATTLSNVFPEISNGLKDLATKLGVANGDSDPISLAIDLGEVYESARSFGETLLRIASNPAARLEQAAIGAVQEILQGFSDPGNQSRFLAALAILAEPIEKALQNQGDLLIAWIVKRFEQDTIGFTRLFALVPPLPDLAAIAAQTGEDVDQAAAKIAQQFQTDATKDLAKDIIEVALGDAFSKPDKIIADVYEKAATQIRAAAKTAEDSAKTQLTALKPAIARAYLEALDALASDVADTAAAEQFARPFWASFKRALDFAAQLRQALEGLRSALKDPNPSKILKAAATLAALIFGYRGTAFSSIDDTLQNAFGDFKSSIADLGKGFKVDAQELRAASTACRIYEANRAAEKRPKPEQSLTALPLQALNALLEALSKADQQIAATREYLDSIDPTFHKPVRIVLAKVDDDAGVSIGAKDWLQAIDDLPAVFDTAGSQQLGLQGDASDLFCAFVGAASAASAASALVQSADWKSFDGALIARITAYSREVQGALESFQMSFEDADAIIGTYLKNLKRPIAGALLAGCLIKLAAIEGLDKPTYGNIVNDLATLRQKAADAERVLAGAVAPAINVAVDILKTAAEFAQTLTTTASTGFKSFSKVSSQLGLSAETGAIDNDVKALGDVVAQIARLQKLDPTGAVPGTIEDLLAAAVGTPDAPLTVSDLLGSKLKSWIKDLFDREAALVADWAALRTRVLGSPEVLQNAVIAILNSGGDGSLLSILSKVYGDKDNGWLALRARVAHEIDIPALTKAARRAVFVAPAYGLFLPPVDVDKEDKPEKLATEDRLAEEAQILVGIVQYDPTTEKAAKTRSDFTRFVQSWAAGGSQGAAPLQIALQIADLAQEVLHGEILALIDISAVRDALLDSVARLVPTSATFSYDFSSAVLDDPPEGGIFQAQKGAVFSLSTRIEVDLLKTDVRLLTTGSMGPFAIHLVGDYIDALTLRFGGAKFESRAGGTPRFDVSYQAYEVGTALKYVKRLEAYLTPSDGAGFRVGPSGSGVGIEAGYSVNFGALSIGPVSFFNIIFAIAAELPFDNKPAIFRVSLGDRLTPFTISALPYSGSGYFAILASAGGIIGFEAGFFFGGGGSLAFGPLQAQVQVQIGAFFRVMRVTADGRTVTVTEAAGTFLAAGSASIWIFHFGASLYVALAQKSNGDMEGEATFTFSFSCGFIHYHYSITARHKQPAVGTGGASAGRSARIEVAPGDQLAFASLPGRLNDAADDLIALAAGARAKPCIPDVTSLAECQSENWALYSSYCDLSLVSGAAGHE